MHLYDVLVSFLVWFEIGFETSRKSDMFQRVSIIHMF